MTTAAVVPRQFVEQWLQASYAQARALLDQDVRLRDAMNALHFYFVRNTIVRNGGRKAIAAATIGTHYNKVARIMRFSNAHMGPVTRTLAEQWATFLACQGATMDEADRVFSAALVNAARERCHDNQCEAARLLGIHRNTVRRISAAVELRGKERA